MRKNRKCLVSCETDDLTQQANYLYLQIAYHNTRILLLKANNILTNEIGYS